MISPHRIRPFCLLLTALALTGCLSDDESGGNDTSTGRLHFNGFSGLSYQTASQSGKTGTNGDFRYYPGERLSFRVGDLPLMDDVPAQPYVTLLEFFPDLRAALTNPSVDDRGLSTHTLTEQQWLDHVPLANLTRFLLALNWTENVRDDRGIEIRDRVIRQLNAALPDLTSPIDFYVSASEFAATGNPPSPANQLLSAICFYPPDNELCEEPPTFAEIDAAPPRPEDENDWDPNVDYREDLQNKRDRILEAARSLEEIDAEAARDYLERELNAITTAVSNRFYLDEETADVPATDTAIKSVQVRRIAANTNLAEIEAISTRPTDVVVHSYSWQTADVEYFVAGETGGESELILSFRPENTYRWIRKSLRVIIR